MVDWMHQCRRVLLGSTAFGAAALAVGVLTARPANAVRMDDHSRFLWVRNRAGEEIAAAFRRVDGQPDETVVAQLQSLFRDLRADTPGPLPVKLLDVLSLIQEGWQYERPLLLHSGFRTLGTNSSLEGAARGSLHLDGQAADIELHRVSVVDLAQAARSFSSIFSFMGVGIYPGFLHVDIGPRRRWIQAAPARPV